MVSQMSEEAEEILKKAMTKELLPDLDPSASPVLRRAEVEKILPHRDPFSFIDDVLCLDIDKGLIATRYDLKRGEFILSGHYPDNPLWPAIFQVEAIAQSGGLVFNLEHKVVGAPGVMTHILEARFMLPVQPGTDMITVVRVLHDGLMIEGIGQCMQNGKICSAGVVKFYTLAEDWE